MAEPLSPMTPRLPNARAACGRAAGEETRLPGFAGSTPVWMKFKLAFCGLSYPMWKSGTPSAGKQPPSTTRCCAMIQPVARGPDSVCHLYVIRTPHRDALREWLAQRGIAAGIHYPAPLHWHPAFRSCGLRKGDLPHAERACGEVLSLPLWPGMPESMVEQVADAIKDFERLAAARKLVVRTASQQHY